MLEGNLWDSKKGGGTNDITSAITLTGCSGILDSIQMKTWESDF